MHLVFQNLFSFRPCFVIPGLGKSLRLPGVTRCPHTGSEEQVQLGMGFFGCLVNATNKIFMLFIWTDGLRTGQNQLADGTAGCAHRGRLFGISKKVVGSIPHVAGHDTTAAGMRGGSMVLLLLCKQAQSKALRVWAATPCTGQMPPRAGRPGLCSQ